MHIVPVTKEYHAWFLEYCKLHRDILDDSFLSDDELANYEPSEQSPAYLLLDEKEEVIGAVSLILSDYLVRGNQARFRIFHSDSQEPAAYLLMFDAVLPYLKNIEHVFLFVREDQMEMRKLLELLDFTPERTAYLLKREDLETAAPGFPDGYTLKTFQFDQDEADYCTVRNAGFARLAGSQTPVTPEEIHKIKDSESYLEGGIFLLYHEGKPVGVARSSKETYSGLVCNEIGPLAVVPEYQGRGLGKNLLRACLAFGTSIGLGIAILSVNAENDKAIEMYLKEGFRKVEAFMCYGNRR